MALPCRRSGVVRSLRVVSLRALSFLSLLLLLLLGSPCSAVVLYHRANPYPAGIDGEPGLFPHSMALFGPDPASKFYSQTETVVWLEDNLSLCAPVVSEADRAAVAGNILLAKRLPADPNAPCTFLDRALNAVNASAKGLIIGDYVDTDSFTSAFLGPYREPPAVDIPVVFVLKSTYDLILKRPNSETTATINRDGLIYDLSDYWAMEGNAERYGTFVKIAIVSVPLLIAAYSYWFWYLSMRNAREALQQQQQQQGQQPPQQQQQQQQQAVAAPADVSVAIHDPDNVAGSMPPQPRPAQPSQFGEHEMQQMSLPVPPHLSSGDTGPDGSNNSGGSAALGQDSVEVSLGNDDHSGRGRRSISLDESEGALLASRHGGSASDAADVDSLSPAVGGAPNRAGLARPLLPLPSVPASRKLYYQLLKSLSQLGKPYWILVLNACMFAVHVGCAAVVLFVGWNEVCPNSNQSMVSLWLARALVGLRICYWQTHSNSARPLCLDIFFKNWADCIFLFTGTLSSFTAEQREECLANAPITFRWVEIWTLTIYVAYGCRILLWGMDKLATHYHDKVPHLFSIGARSLLSVSQGGFSCAGALDANQPATQLDLLLIPVIEFSDGMYAPDDAVCGVCLGEYAAGEELRVLNCSHHFHRSCVDTWLTQKNSCPTCRASIDAPPSERLVQQRAAASASPPVNARPREQGQEMMPPRRSPAAFDRPPSPSMVSQQRPSDFAVLSGGEPLDEL